MDDTAQWNRTWQSCPQEPTNTFAVRAYRIIRARRMKTLLDLGCGAGRDAVYFSRKGLTVTAIDSSKTGIAKLKSRDPRIHCILDNLHTIKLKKNSFDIIYAHLSLHYFNGRTTRRIFRIIHHALKPKGLFFVKCKSTDDPLYGKGLKLERDMYRKGHTRHFFSKDYMRELLAPFTILNIRKTSSIYHHYKSAFIEAIAMK
ncbi:MAG: class I SAM-dependent methyltransferase [Patescibacteria group bacterium]